MRSLKNYYEWLETTVINSIINEEQKINFFYSNYCFLYSKTFYDRNISTQTIQF